MRDRKLSMLSLGVALLFIGILLWADLYDAVQHVPGGEAFYNCNRVFMLVAGKRPYLDF